MTQQLTINGVEFSIESSGFGHAEAARDEAVNNLYVVLRTIPAADLRTIPDNELHSLATTAVSDATAGWRCWTERGYYGDFPMISAARTEGAVHD